MSAIRPQFLYVPKSWRVRVNRCCEFHWLNVQVGPFIWRWSR